MTTTTGTYRHATNSGYCSGHQIDLEVTCPFRLVDRCAHDYRIQASRFERGYGVRNADQNTCTREDAEYRALQLQDAGYTGVSIMTPRCDGTH